MSFAAPDALVLPARVGPYELTRLIGRGAIGSVYEASDTAGGARVAVKLLHPHLAHDPLFRSRLEGAAELASRLTSPYTARLYDWGETDGRYYLAGQLVEGQTLREVLAVGRVSLSRSLDIARQVALALEEAESKGLVHGDVRPGNIYLTADSRVRVLDFGLTRRLQEGILTVAQDFSGTQRYAAPETFTSGVTHQSDVYSLGAVLFHCLTGRPPFEGRTLLDLIRQHEQEPIPSDLLSGYPDRVGEMVMGCLEKDRERRYQTAGELVVALERAARAAALESERRGEVTIVSRSAATLPGESLTVTHIGPAGGSEKLMVRIETELRVGTAPDNDLVLTDDRTVSGHHARIRRDRNGLMVEDLGSRNGTFIEREGRVIRVAVATPMQTGDSLRLGATRLAFMPNEPERPSPPTRVQHTPGPPPPARTAPPPPPPAHVAPTAPAAGQSPVSTPPDGGPSASGIIGAILLIAAIVAVVAVVAWFAVIR